MASFETYERIGPGRERRGRHLDRDVTAQPRVAGAVDFATTRADRRFQRRHVRDPGVKATRDYRARSGVESGLGPLTADPARWRRLESVVHAALERPAGERADFLAEACGADDDLRREALSLLDRDGRAEGFLGTPIDALAAGAMVDAPAGQRERSALAIGQTIAHYRIVKAIGAGGMGEVYLAQDTRLDRQVALKILPPDLAGDAERRVRFTREAKAVAALNHPNIVTVHAVEEADGLHFITMELVRGRTLADLLPRTGFGLTRSSSWRSRWPMRSQPLINTASRIGM